MAKKALVDSILKLYSKLGGNVGDVLGTRTNINFLGVGKSPEGFIDSTINVDAIGALGKNKILEELKSSIGYLTANKLNDLQAGKLYENMLKVDNVFNPQQISNITDMATGTRNLDAEGIMTLRRGGDPTQYKPGDPITSENFGATGFAPSEEVLANIKATRKTDDDMRIIKDRMTGDENLDYDWIETPKGWVKKPGSEGAFYRFGEKNKEFIDKSAADIYKPRGTNEIDALETMTKNKAGTEFITGYVDDVYRNSGVTASVDVPKKRAAAREFLFTMLKKETDLLPPGSGGTLESVITPTDYKYITEGGGGALGDPLILVKKYFGDTIAKRLPLNSDKEVIETFVENVRFTKDKAGFPTDDPRFNPDDLPEFKHGGLAQILEV